MNYQKIETCNIGNGLGFRVVLWVSGCGHHCPGCQNPETWNPNYGKVFTTKQKEQILKYLDLDYISGITLSGGDPLFESNRDTIEELCKEIKEYYPNKNIWLYTGYKYEKIKNLTILDYIDILIDGKYKNDKRDITLAFRGSTNQRIIDIKKTKIEGKIVEWEEVD